MSKPSEAQIEKSLRRVVKTAERAGQEVSVTGARSWAEKELGLGEGFFKNDAVWKRRSKGVIEAAFQDDDDVEEAEQAQAKDAKRAKAVEATRAKAADTPKAPVQKAKPIVTPQQRASKASTKTSASTIASVPKPVPAPSTPKPAQPLAVKSPEKQIKATQISQTPTRGPQNESVAKTPSKKAAVSALRDSVKDSTILVSTQAEATSDDSEDDSEDDSSEDDTDDDEEESESGDVQAGAQEPTFAKNPEAVDPKVNGDDVSGEESTDEEEDDDGSSGGQADAQEPTIAKKPEGTAPKVNGVKRKAEESTGSDESSSDGESEESSDEDETHTAKKAKIGPAIVATETGAGKPHHESVTKQVAGAKRKTGGSPTSSPSSSDNDSERDSDANDERKVKKSKTELVPKADEGQSEEDADDTSVASEADSDADDESEAKKAKVDSTAKADASEDEDDGEEDSSEEESETDGGSDAEQVKAASKSRPQERVSEEDEDGESRDSVEGDDDEEEGSESESDDDETASRVPDSQAQPQSEETARRSFAPIPAKLFTPPAGYTAIRPDQLLINPTLSSANLEGKQIWHISTPSQLPLSSITSLSLNDLQSGNTVIDHNNTSYTITSSSSTNTSSDHSNIVLMLPSETGYTTLNQTITRSLQIQQQITLPHLTARQSNQAAGSAAAADIAQPATTSVRPQPKGLRMRYKPPGFGPGKPGRIGSGSSDSAEDDAEEQAEPSRAIFQFPKALGAHGTSMGEVAGGAETSADVEATATPKKAKKKRKEKEASQTAIVNGVSKSPQVVIPAPDPAAKKTKQREDTHDSTSRALPNGPNGVEAENEDEKAKRTEEKRLKKERKETKRKAKESSS